MRWRARQRDHQHAAAHAAALAGADAGQRHHRAGRHEGGEAARPRSGRRSAASTRPKARRSTARRLPNGSAVTSPSAFVKEALDRGAELFDWHDARGARRASGSGIEGRAASASPSARTAPGSIGFDGLMTIRPDGKLYVQSGVGNLGTHSVIDLARVAADVLAMPWEKVVVIWGNTGKDLPWTCLSVGSQTTHAMTRANHGGARWTRSGSCRRLPRRISAARRTTTRSAASACSARGNPVARPDLRAGGDARDRARRQVRRPRAARRHPRGHEESAAAARRPGPDGRRQGHLSARRRHLFVRRRLRRSGSGRRDRQS